MLAEIIEMLGQDISSDLQLPAYEEGEDFVEGTLQFDGTPLRIYYEHSLGYFLLAAESEATVRAVANRVQSIVVVVAPDLEGPLSIIPP